VTPASNLTAPIITYCVDTLVPDGMLTVLSGKDKRGKTLLAQEIVRAVLTHAPLFGAIGVRQGPVVAAFLDDPLALTVERLDTLGIHYHPALGVVKSENYKGEPFQFLDQLSAEVKARGAVLVVIDALYLLSPTTQNAGNDAARMTPIMRRLDQLATETGAAVILIAHDNKAGGDVAGSFTIRAMAKTILRLTLQRGDEQTDDDTPTTARRLLKIESKLTPAHTLVLEVKGVGEWALLGNSTTVRVDDTRSAIVAHLAAQAEPVPEKEIHSAIPGRRETKVTALRALVSEGRVRRTGEGTKNHPYLYAAPPGGI
jgi:archaellum biogenesis ATPase FlaH